MSAIIVLIALGFTMLGTFLLAIASKRELRAQIKIKWGLRLVSLMVWGLSLLLLQQIQPLLQALFSWLGMLSLGAILVVFSLPWLVKPLAFLDKAEV